MKSALSLITSCYRGLDYLTGYFENLKSQSLFPQLEVVFVHNDPLQEELVLVETFKSSYPQQIQHLIVPREPLGASWNRGWRAAQAPLVGMWNMDDRRPADSLLRQVQTLQEHPQSVLTYGDFLEVPAYGLEEGQLVSTPDFSRAYFSRSFPQRGAFLVWRRESAQKTGYFDEQLLIGADFDLSLRMVLGGNSFCKTSGLVGYFTNAASGLSTADGAVAAAVERTFIQQRYAIYDKVRSEYLPAAAAFRLDQLQNFGEWQPITNFLPQYDTYCRSRKALKIIAWFRNTFRQLFRQLGILELIYRLQKRFLKRDL